MVWSSRMALGLLSPLDLGGAETMQDTIKPLVLLVGHRKQRKPSSSLGVGALR